jgi:UDPglucose--hexose-1-phosphate uridylyltransferase
MPRRHEARFEEASRHTLAATATALRNLVFALNAWVGEASYNLAIHTAPPQSDCAASFHWRIELMPRLTGVAGFEWATGIHVNQVTPEEAAKSYRANWGGRSTTG